MGLNNIPLLRREDGKRVNIFTVLTQCRILRSCLCIGVEIPKRNTKENSIHTIPFMKKKQLTDVFLTTLSL
jgi:hypothetical protein